MNDYGPKAPKKPTPAPGPAPAPGINTKAPTKVPKTKKPTTTKAVQQPEQDAQDFENDVAIISTTQSTVIQSELEDDVQQQTYEEDDQHIEPQKQISKDDWADDINNGEIELNKENLLSQPQPLLTPTTNAHSIPPQDNTIIKPFSQGQSESCSQVPMCQHFCNPTTQKIINDATTIKEIANQLNANEFIQTFPSASEQIQTIIDTQNSYTIFMPSNNAISQLPQNLVHHLQNDQDALRNMIDNHILDTTQSLEDMRLAEIIQPRALGASLRVNSPRNQTYTVNGQRIMIADQQGPGGGMIHVIDGLLYPTSDRDILGTLKTCNRFDGFITLAEGTGFAETLKQTGPFTVFVPSNEALQKVPDSDLDIIRNNMTALKEFLKYHVAQGSYYSSDLRDGQFIPSLIDNHPIQVGVRVDGCLRRLVEANVSPLYRADIPATNGVIHVVDWVLKPNDRDWCEGFILPR